MVAVRRSELTDPNPVAGTGNRGWAADTRSAGIRAAGTGSAVDSPAAGRDCAAGPAPSARPRAATVLATWPVTIRRSAGRIWPNGLLVGNVTLWALRPARV